MPLSGNVRQYLAMSGNVWQYMALPGRSQAGRIKKQLTCKHPLSPLSPQQPPCPYCPYNQSFRAKFPLTFLYSFFADVYFKLLDGKFSKVKNHLGPPDGLPSLLLSLGEVAAPPKPRSLIPDSLNWRFVNINWEICYHELGCLLL